MKLGRISPRTDRLSALPLFPDYASSLPAPPPSVDWQSKVKSWPMMANDRYGDCTCACVGHLVQLWTTANGAPVVLSDADVLGLYAAVTGFDPDKPETDNGAVMVDVLDYWRKTGVAGHRLAGYARTRVGHHDHVKQAIALMGGVCLGVAFPSAWFDQDTWDVGRGPKYRPEGGHEVPAVGYDSKTLTVVSWGRLYRLTWAALDRYCEEIEVPVSADWADADGAPSGFDLKTLLADMGALRGARS